MKKTFELTHPKIEYARMVEKTKSEVRKYLKRERKRELPEGMDYWDFDCRFGDTEAEAKPVHWSEINKPIDEAAVRQLKSFYVEILAKPAARKSKDDEAVEEVIPEPPKKVELPKLKTFGSE